MYHFSNMRLDTVDSYILYMNEKICYDDFFQYLMKNQIQFEILENFCSSKYLNEVYKYMYTYAVKTKLFFFTYNIYFFYFFIDCTSLIFAVNGCEIRRLKMIEKWTN